MIRGLCRQHTLALIPLTRRNLMTPLNHTYSYWWKRCSLSEVYYFSTPLCSRGFSALSYMSTVVSLWLSNSWEGRVKKPKNKFSVNAERAAFMLWMKMLKSWLHKTDEAGEKSVFSACCLRPYISNTWRLCRSADQMIHIGATESN